MSTQAARGDKLLAEKKYEEAVEAYTAALKEFPTSPHYYSQRAAAHHKALQYAEALQDADKAAVFAYKRQKRELIIEAQSRRGPALVKLGRYADAKFVLGIVKRMDKEEKTHHIWLNIAEGKLKGMSEDDEMAKVTVKEIPVVDVDADDASGKSESATSGAALSTGTSNVVPVQQTPADKIRHDWYQNNDNIYFSLLAKGVPKDKTQVDITPRAMTISFPIGDSGSSYDFTLDPLFADVVPDKCTSRVLSTKVEIVLVKATPGQKWAKLESDEAAPAPKDSPVADSEQEATKRAVLTAPKPAGPAYPTSSKSGPKNWDLIGEEAGKDTTGDEANDFFKTLFKGADPDTQRAMMKSYTESNGTALSTNWSEVSKGKVETTPPDGMEAKKWNA